LTFAQDERSSGYRLRYERGQSQLLEVDAEEPATEGSGSEETSRAMASLSDDELAEQEPAGSEPLADDAATLPPIVNAAQPPVEYEPRPEIEPPPGYEPQGRAPLTTAALPSAPEQPPPRSGLKISPRKESGGRQLAAPGIAGANGAITTVVGSLAVVLGLFAVVVWVSRRMGPQATAPLPKEAVELLGRTTISGQHALQLVRVGGRLLLVALSPHGAATLTEIIDPHEVERLTALCLRQRAGSSTASFQQAMSELERQPTSRGFVDQRRPATSAANRPRTSSFRT
jgi:flagellar biogenesis protein FliO